MATYNIKQKSTTTYAYANADDAQLKAQALSALLEDSATLNVDDNFNVIVIKHIDMRVTADSKRELDQHLAKMQANKTKRNRTSTIEIVDSKLIKGEF